MPYYSRWGGDIQQLSNGNFEFDASNPSGILSVIGSRVTEMTPDTQQIIWQMEIQNQSAYRAYRMPSLYPGVQW